MRPPAVRQGGAGGLAERLGVAATCEAIAAITTDHLLAAQLNLRADIAANPDPERWGSGGGGQYDAVASSGRRELIPTRPLDRIASGASSGVDLMVGSTTDEWRLFLCLMA